MSVFIKICSFLFFIQSFSQTTSNQEKIKNYIATYFYYDRENIHVQFNKTVYVNTEDLAFKGYVWSKNNNAPHANTTNVQLIVYNEQQEIVQKQLLFTNKGTFSGGIHLNNKFKTGKYYFHFYTNWMNNFKEDDSFTQVIEIINQEESYTIKTSEPNWKSATVTLFLESGFIVNEINNTVGVSIKDCNNKGIQINDGIILDSSSNEVAHFKTNKMGNGVFYFIPKINERYSLKIKSDKLTISQPLPKVQETGIILTYNNNLPNNKLIIALKTNEKGVELYQNKTFTLLIQQNGNSIQKEINFQNKETTQSLLLDKKLLSTGVNSIRLIDENLNQITERLIYYYAENSNSITTLEAKTVINDSIALFGKTDANQANLSISVLPENNICFTQKRAIQGTFYLNAYLENPEIENYSYFDYNNKERIQDMELLMLNQNKSKFLWKNIKSNPPKMNYVFDKGVTISGKVDKKMSPNSNYKISLVSMKENIFEETKINDNGEFKFENFFVQDSTVFVLQMINEKNLAIAAKITAKVAPNQTMFPLAVRINKTICPVENATENSFRFSNPKLENSIINLKEVSIIGKKKDVLKHQLKADMSANASSFKIKEGDFGKVLDFIGRNGYRTGVNETNDVFIKSARNSYLGDSAGTPAIFIDNVELLDLNFLFNLFLNDVDEIYIDQSGASNISSEGNGTIKIFLRQNTKKKYFNIKYTPIIATKGFAENIEYKISQFETQKEFYYFGTLNWSAKVKIDSNNNYEIKFPRGNQKEIQVLLEGFSEDGKLISEMKKIPISAL